MSAGTVISHWSPLNMGISRAEVMSLNLQARGEGGSIAPQETGRSQRVQHGTRPRAVLWFGLAFAAVRPRIAHSSSMPP
eukprot:7387865-Prymnesium_polylepis.1